MEERMSSLEETIDTLIEEIMSWEEKYREEALEVLKTYSADDTLMSLTGKPNELLKLLSEKSKKL
jgi:hypothetical protein